MKFINLSINTAYKTQLLSTFVRLFNNIDISKFKCSIQSKLRTGYDVYNIQSEHVVYRTYSRQPINSLLPILKVMCGM